MLRTYVSIGFASALLTVIVAQQAAGQTKAEAAPPKAGTRLITLGTAGGPPPRAHRAQSSNALIVNGTVYVIDAGDGVARRLAKAGIRFLDVGTIFITHDHDDHTGGLASLLSVEWDFQRKQAVNVYGPPGTDALVRGAIQEYTVNAEIRWAEGRRTPLAQVFVGNDVGVGEIYRDRNIRVVAAENSHFHLPEGSPPFGKYKSYSYRFETPDRTIVFTGDTGPSDAVTTLAKGADVLVTEVTSIEEVRQSLIRGGIWQTMNSEQQRAFLQHIASEHLTPEAIAKLARQANVKAAILSHLPPSADPNDDYKRLADAVKKDFSGEVTVAKDLMEF